MSRFIKLNIQTMLGGVLLGVGTYPEDRLNSNAIKQVEEYISEQSALPLDSRRIPPYFEIIDPDKKEELGGVDGYVIMDKKALRNECKQRGIKFDSKDVEATLIELLVADDEEKAKVLVVKSQFKSQEEFEQLPSDVQVEYLDGIFCLPDGIDEESEEAQKYSDDLVVAVKSYSGLSLSQETVDKVKEIVDYYAE